MKKWLEKIKDKCGQWWPSVKPVAVAAGLALFLSSIGCASQPSLMSVLTSPAPAANVANFNDYSTVVFLDQTLQGWGKQSSLSQTLSLGGALTIAALGTAAFATVGAEGTSRAFMLGANSILIAMGIIKPSEKVGVYAQGSRLLEDALGEYAVALIGAGYCTVPTDRATAPGALLLQKTLAARSAVNDMLADLMPRQEDYRKLATANERDMSPPSSRAGQTDCR